MNKWTQTGKGLYTSNQSILQYDDLNFSNMIENILHFNCT